MKFSINNAATAQIETDCLVIGVYEDAPLQGPAAIVDKAANGALQDLLDSGDIDTSWKHTTLLHGIAGIAAKRILVIGCGEPEKFDPVRFDLVCARAGEYLRDHAATVII